DQDDWRNRCRGALLAHDQKALEALADEVSPRDHAPATLYLLADTLKQLGASEKAIGVLRRAQRQYPDDLWLNGGLAWTSIDGLQPPRYADASGFTRSPRPCAPGRRGGAGPLPTYLRRTTRRSTRPLPNTLSSSR